MAVEACPSIHVDTSSSNGWTRYVPGLSLAEVFRRTLAVAGPERVLFGTDSSFFPRGWQAAIHAAQQSALNEIGATAEAGRMIFAANFDRIFPDPGAPGSGGGR
jgi:predicted TIM-barrel fold metal-dependent hydrolase